MTTLRAVLLSVGAALGCCTNILCVRAGDDAPAKIPVADGVTVESGQTAVIILSPEGKVLQIVKLGGATVGVGRGSVCKCEGCQAAGCSCVRQPTKGKAQPAPTPADPPKAKPTRTASILEFGGAKEMRWRALRLTTAERAKLPKLRANFLAAAGQIESGKLKSAEAVSEYLRARNQEALGEGELSEGFARIFDGMKELSDKLYGNQRINTLGDYARLFREFADGMTDASDATHNTSQGDSHDAISD